MSADCEWKLTLKSDICDISAILNYLNTVDQDAFSVSQDCIVTDNGLASHIWGTWSYMDPNVETYIMLAKAAPKAEWEVESSVQYEGGGGNDQSYLEANYAGGILSFSKLTYANRFWCDPDYWHTYKYKIYDLERGVVAEQLIEERKATKHDKYDQCDD